MFGKDKNAFSSLKTYPQDRSIDTVLRLNVFLCESKMKRKKGKKERLWANIAPLGALLLGKYLGTVQVTRVKSDGW